LFYIQVCSMDQKVMLDYPWYHQRCLLHLWPQIVTLWATIATHFWAKNGRKRLKTGFDNTYLHNLLFHTQIYSIGQQVVFSYPMVSPKVPTTLVTPNSYSMSHQSHSFKRKNDQKRLKQVFDDTYFRNLLFYTQICSMGQQVVFNYPTVSPKVPTTLRTPYSYPIGHHCHSFVRKNGRKRLKTVFWWY
jgi:hypothetical protein